MRSDKATIPQLSNLTNEATATRLYASATATSATSIFVEPMAAHCNFWSPDHLFRLVGFQAVGCVVETHMLALLASSGHCRAPNSFCKEKVMGERGRVSGQCRPNKLKQRQCLMPIKKRLSGTSGGISRHQPFRCRKARAGSRRSNPTCRRPDSLQGDARKGPMRGADRRQPRKQMSDRGL